MMTNSKRNRADGSSKDFSARSFSWATFSLNGKSIASSLFQSILLHHHCSRGARRCKWCRYFCRNSDDPRDRTPDLTIFMPE
jgi:hypothetical protein